MSTSVACLSCGWQTERHRSEDRRGYGTCNRCGQPLYPSGTARALRQIQHAQSDFARLRLAISDGPSDTARTRKYAS